MALLCSAVNLTNEGTSTISIRRSHVVSNNKEFDSSSNLATFFLEGAMPIGTVSADFPNYRYERTISSVATFLKMIVKTSILAALLKEIKKFLTQLKNDGRKVVTVLSYRKSFKRLLRDGANFTVGFVAPPLSYLSMQASSAANFKN
jgi:hypothetical protein